MTRMDDHRRILENEILALWLAPLVSTLPLIPFFSFRFSPLFLGVLMADASHPTNWPWLGPLQQESFLTARFSEALPSC
jgi:hypothetical protein